MRYLGLLIIAIAGGLMLSEHVKAVRADARAYIAVGRFLRRIEQEITVFSRSPVSIADVLSSSNDTELCRLSALIRDPSCAMKLELGDKGDKERLAAYFEKLGRNRKEGEIAAAGAIAEYFERLGAEKERTREKRIRALSIVYGAAILSALIILM